MIVKEIQWEITNRCNLRCKHCLALSGNPRQNELTTEETMVALAKFRSAGATNIYFTGGEPFIRSDFLTLLQKASELGLDIRVITNATMLNERILKAIKEFGVKLGISLDGADALTNDIIRGQGTFGKVIKTLQWCQNSGIPVQLYVVVVSSNIGQLKALGRLAKDYGCTGIHFNEVTLTGRALEFVPELVLSTKEHDKLPTIVANLANEIFGEKLSEPNDYCWADGSIVYMASDGNICLCSEVSQRRPDLALGNIRSFSIQEQVVDNTQLLVHQKCCYRIQTSEHVTLISNISSLCFLTPEPARIETLEELYREIDELYKGISLYCERCRDLDCLGYIWLLPEEAKTLYEHGVEILEINGNICFINPFAGRNRKIDIKQVKPPCPLHRKKKCTIYSKRPLMCRIYPLSFAAENGTIYLVLHLDCAYSREKANDTIFQDRAINLFKRIDPSFLKEVLEAFQLVEHISKFPEGPNNYLRLISVDQLSPR